MEFKQFWEENKNEIMDAIRRNNQTFVYQKFETCWCNGFRNGYNQSHNQKINSDRDTDKPDPNCPDCHGTGWYGDNGPGIKGNSEWCPCECTQRSLS